MERAEEDEDEAKFLPHEQKATCGPKKKTLRKNSSCFHSTFANKKIPWLAFLAIAMILRLVQKRFFSALRKKDGILLVSQERKRRSFFRCSHRRRFAVYISLYL